MKQGRGTFIFAALLSLSLYGTVWSQPAAPAVPVPVEKPKEYPDFAEVVTAEFTKIEGFYNIYKHNEKEIAYLEIPAGALEQDFLMAMTIAGGSSFTGWQWGDAFLYWKIFGKEVALLERQLQYRATDTSSPLGQAFARTYKDSLVTSYGIETMNGGNPVINLAALTLNDMGTFFGSWFNVADSSLAKYSQLKSFPENLEVSVEFPDPSGNFITLHYSIRHLPTSDYQAREADDRIGYFLTAYKDLVGGKSEEGNFVRYIHRWNLKKQDAELKNSPVVNPIIFYIEKTVPFKHRYAVREGIAEWNKAFEKLGYLNAIVVRQQTETNEFKDLDPADSRYNFFRWIASEQPFAAGPSRVDPRTGEILDADIIFDASYLRYTEMQYDRLISEGSEKSRNPRQRAYWKKYPKKHPMAKFAKILEEKSPLHETDQQILKSLEDENQTHLSKNVCMIAQGKAHEFNRTLALMDMLNYFEEGKPEAGATPSKEDPRRDEFIFQFIKDTVMHEVGHTLGLRHNFKASSWRSLKEINSNPPPADISASVMDYNATNLKSVEKEAVQGNYQMATLGPYDYWAIEYGYTADAAADALSKIASLSAKPEHAFATDEDTGSPDPLIRRWDLGNDPIAYAEHRLALIKAFQKDLLKRSVKTGESYRNLTAMFNMVLVEHYMAGNTALAYLAGEEVHRDHFGDPDGHDPICLVSTEKQRKALEFVCKNLLSPDSFQFSASELTKLAPSQWGMGWSKEHSYDVYFRLLKIQTWLLDDMLNGEIFTRLYNQELKTKESSFLTLPELFSTVRNAVWAELNLKRETEATNNDPMIKGFRRDLQRAHLQMMIDLSMEGVGSGWNPAVARTLASMELKTLKEEVDQALKNPLLGKDAYSRSHLEETSTRIQKALDAAYSLSEKEDFWGSFFIIIGKQPPAENNR
ncbi:MAG: zinc-dependent metalloprotease [Planctomycetota bacterium]